MGNEDPEGNLFYLFFNMRACLIQKGDVGGGNTNGLPRVLPFRIGGAFLEMTSLTHSIITIPENNGNSCSQ